MTRKSRRQLSPFVLFAWALIVISISTFSTFIFSTFIFSTCAFADVTLPSVLADHMVVQRGLPVHVWGAAAPLETVSATFRGDTRTTTADDLGRWSIYLAVGEAGGPFSLVVKAANTITLNDVMVGDVWVASGQSNMEFPMTGLRNADAEIAAAQHQEIRIFLVDHRPADYPQPDVPAKTWALCTPESAAKSSAVAYYFARDITAKEHVAIGLIETFWGGSLAEAWTSLHSLSADASLMPVFAERAKMVDEQSTTVLQRAQENAAFQKAVAQAKADGKPAPWPAWHSDFAGWAPAALYNGMIAPLTPYAIRGVIWYQGESNAGPERAYWYAHLFQTMIRDWRNSWDEGDFPFLYVQLANWKTGPDAKWPVARDQQRQTLQLKNTGMAVIIDVGDPDDLHPKDKLDVGLRLALAARSIAYGEKIEWSGPLYKQLTREDHALRVWFDHADGLVAKGGELTGFEVAGADGKYSPAQATIDGTSVVVSSTAVPTPVSVRYAWADAPICNLYNRARLPASPFQAPE